MIKKIYSAVDADEVKAMLEKDLVVSGYTGDSLDDLFRREEEGDLVQVLHIRGTEFASRFLAKHRATSLFALVSVVQHIDVTNSEVKL